MTTPNPVAGQVPFRQLVAMSVGAHAAVAVATTPELEHLTARLYGSALFVDNALDLTLSCEVDGVRLSVAHVFPDDMAALAFPDQEIRNIIAGMMAKLKQHALGAASPMSTTERSQ